MDGGIGSSTEHGGGAVCVPGELVGQAVMQSRHSLVSTAFKGPGSVSEICLQVCHREEDDRGSA